MYIQFENPVQRFHNDDYMPEGYVIEPNDNGVAQVTEDVGTALVNNFETIREYSAD